MSLNLADLVNLVCSSRHSHLSLLRPDAAFSLSGRAPAFLTICATTSTTVSMGPGLPHSGNRHIGISTPSYKLAQLPYYVSIQSRWPSRLDSPDDTGGTRYQISQRSLAVVRARWRSHSTGFAHIRSNSMVCLLRSFEYVVLSHLPTSAGLILDTVIHVFWLRRCKYILHISYIPSDALV